MAVRLVCALIVVGLCGATPTFAAPPTTKATSIGRKGDAHFKAGRYREALERYDEAWKLAPAPVLLWNRARCHEELGELERAAALFEELAASDAPAARRAEAERRAEALRGLIAKRTPPQEVPATEHPPVEPAHVEPPVEPPLVVHTGAIEDGPGALLRTNGLMLIVVSPIVELEVTVAERWSIEAGLAFGMPVSGRDFGLAGLLGARWYPLQRAPDGWFIELAALVGGATSGAPADTFGALVGASTGYQYLAWQTLALGIAAGPGILATADGVIFYPALRADVGIAF